MPHYQELVFGCANMPRGLTERNPMSEAEMLWDWIDRVSETAHIPLDWPCDTIIIGAREGDQRNQVDIFGVVIAISHEHARPLLHPVPHLGSMLPKEASSITALISVSNNTGNTITLTGDASPRPEPILI